MSQALHAFASTLGARVPGLTFGTRFIRLASYLGEELLRTLGGAGALLARTRLRLVEQVPPMSLHLGVVRVALDDATPIADVLSDTTNSDRNHPVLATVGYRPVVRWLVETVRGVLPDEDFGALVDAF